MTKPSPQDLRVLLVQAREEPDMEAQEQVCFLERCGIREDQMFSRNVVAHQITPSLLDEADVLMIGGAGAFSATRDYTWTDSVLDLVRAAAERAFPTFGSCWGHQMIARALGGRVEYDSNRAEMGCHHVALTPAGQRDELLGSFPARFLVNMGHHDRVTKLPESAVELAYNDSQPNQAFRIDGIPMYGTQFHSELDARRERERLFRYRQHYLTELPDDEAFQRAVDSLRDTTEVDHLLSDFLRLFVAAP